MDISSGNISSIIFRRVVRSDIGEFSLDSHMLGILMELDGEKSLGEVASNLGMNMGTIRSVVSKLLSLQLIEATGGAVKTLSGEFMDYLVDQLSLAIGPIADVILEDTVEDMGYTPGRFPAHQAAELVDILSREIRREEKKAEFKLNMVKKIKSSGY